MRAFDVVIVGGGAAGLMCAIAAGNRGRRVVVLEGANRIGKKILISGGGRCNFTNQHCDPSRFISANPNFCISALRRYTQWDFIALVEKHGIPYHEKARGELFCDRSSKEIVAMLAAECEAAGVCIVTGCAISAVDYGAGYVVRTDQGTFAAKSLVIATGGLSIPKMGATDFGYRLARQFGLQVVATRAGLVPFTFTGATLAMTSRLSGVSAYASVTAGATTFTGNLLFTHRGLSGPAVLQASSYWSPGEAISINLVPQADAAESLLTAKTRQPGTRLRTALADCLPKSLVQELQQTIWPAAEEQPLAEFADNSLRSIGRALENWTLKPAATEGYRTAEVTVGGIDTNELSSKTMEARNQPGLYCIGEVVDVTGHLGGFNFQWAWASGQAAGEVV